MTSSELKQARLAMGLTQVAFSAILGIQLQKYKRWESGASRVSDEGETLIKMIMAGKFSGELMSYFSVKCMEYGAKRKAAKSRVKTKSVKGGKND